MSPPPYLGLTCWIRFRTGNKNRVGTQDQLSTSAIREDEEDHCTLLIALCLVVLKKL
jgi:hypothetical protein